MATDSILVVEDDPTLVHAISRNLTVRDYPIRSAMSVAAALEALAAARPTLLVLDIDLPDGSGWEVLRASQARGAAPVPAIVMSALRPNPRLCAELQTVGVLEKPFPMDSLLRLIAQQYARLREPAAVETAQARQEGYVRVRSHAGSAAD